jgi:hypothetical protein
MDYRKTNANYPPIVVPSRRGVRRNPDGTVSSHLMATETLDGKNWVSFPTLFQDPDGTWVDKSKGKWIDAYKEAKRRGEVIEFGPDKERALRFGEGSWKSSYSPEPSVGMDPFDFISSEIMQMMKK